MKRQPQFQKGAWLRTYAFGPAIIEGVYFGRVQLRFGPKQSDVLTLTHAVATRLTRCPPLPDAGSWNLKD